MKLNIGVLLGLTTGITFAAYAIINRYVFNTYDVGGFDYLVTFSAVNGLCGALSLGIRGDRKKFSHPNFKHVVASSMIGIAALSLLIFAQSKTTATNISILSSLVIVSTALWSQVILRERLSKQGYGWMLVLLAAVYLVIAGFTWLGLNNGDLILLGSVALFGAYNAYGKKIIPEFGGVFIVDFRLVLGALLLAAAAYVASGDTSFIVTNASYWPIAAGVLAYLTISFTFQAMHYISATNALVLFTSHVIFTMLGAAIFLDESLSPLKIAGSLAILFAIYKIVHAKTTRST